jgi:hypothetical protein
MSQSIEYQLVYKKLGETIIRDNFPSVFAALEYCKNEKIEEPMAIHRIETLQEKVLDRSQIEKLLRIQD